MLILIYYISVNIGYLNGMQEYYSIMCSATKNYVYVFITYTRQHKVNTPLLYIVYSCQSTILEF